jgi:outer membrane protein
VQALQDQLVEIRARRKAGEVTLTDQAQAEAQLASEQALYASAQGQLQLSRSEYFAAVGLNPGQLTPAPDLPNVPASPDQAFDLAERTSPDLFAAQWTETQSRDEIVAARAANRPTVSVRASFGYDGSLAPYVNRNDERTVTGEAVISQPLFTSGLNASLIRQAIEQNTSERINIEAARRSMIQNVANAWNQRWTAQANVVAQVAQVKAAELAYRGMKVEYRAGERSTLDVLVAEETLRDAQLALIAAHHDVYLNTAAILRYVGRLEIHALMQGTPLYDPTQHFRTVANSGALPWEPLIQHIDALASPTANQHAIAAPATAFEPRIADERGAIPSAAMATALPTVPIPGTVSATSLAKDWIAEGQEAPKN